TAPTVDPNWGMWSRDGLGLQTPFDGVVPSLERDALLRPEALHDRQLLLESGATLLQVHTVEGELIGLVADGDTERHPSFGHHVEQRDVLGEPDRMVERGDEDVGAEHHLRCPRREAGQDRQWRRPVVVRDGMMLFHPD